MTIDATHLTSLFENATEGIILTNGQGSIVMVNPAAERIFEYEADELIGNTIEILIPDSMRAHHHTLRQDFYKKPGNRQMGHGRDLYARKKDGSGIPVEVSLSFYKKNEELFVIAFIVDITERKKSEVNIRTQQQELEHMARRMQRLNAQLETKVEERTLILKEALKKLEESQKDLSDALDKEKQLNEIKTRFVSMASHEFRTPLSTVLSSAALISKYTEGDQQDQRNRHVDKIRNSVKHLNDLLEDFLSLGKLDEGKVETHPSEFNAKEAILDIFDDLKGLLKPGQEFAYEHTGSEELFSDRKMIKNIFVNLLTNAIKFSDEGKVIEIKSHVNEEGLQFSVKDHGIGIPEEDQQHLFSSFFRGKNVLNIQGTGLGLHIIKRYLSIINGTIQLESKLNKGTKFDVFIPNQLSN
ncbi:PAS domain-containing sensor histidine kinase [Terrimonas sp. NA20]|uniref:histidine kinase n=1 Tax=Terrimonas ginsenosidimutans TaxID=2908004 RepID=A0ABS9KSR5_9BACT|nr:PAS domain-containing sensor histidine kinase [Terrimonas ginsenosidimutans]MCG2615340.1 PAS domain-containing sensor histidine kinase [Terrimonas ginsenosidimutans]